MNLEKLPAAPGEEDEHVRSFGRYENEKEFSTASPQLLQYARREWLKFVKEKIGE